MQPRSLSEQWLPSNTVTPPTATSLSGGHSHSETPPTLQEEIDDGESLTPIESQQKLRGSESSRRTHKTTACDECRKRRSRCGPRIPCEQCVKRGIECTFANRGDGRSREARKRALEESQEATKKSLSNVLDILRASNSQDFDSFMVLVRGGAPVEEVMLYLEQRLREEDPDSPLSQAMLDAEHQMSRLDQKGKHRKMPIGLTLQYHPTPTNVPSQPWTTVTDDDGLVSVLTSLFIAWLQPHKYGFIKPETYLQAMRSGSIESTFCSPLLCNAILSEACTYYDSPDKEDLALRFFEEATRLWEVEELRGRSCITNVQGLMCLSLRHQLSGNDRLGWHFLNKAVVMQKHLQSQIKAKPLDGPSASDQAISRSVVKAGWALFNLHARMSLAQMKPIDVLPPTVEPLGDGSTCCEEVEEWAPYPLSLYSLDVHRSCGFRAECQIALITQSLANLYYGQSHPDTAKVIQSLKMNHTRLQAWYQNLPSCLSMQGNPWPHVICLHAMYHWVRIVLFSLLEKEKIIVDTRNEPSRAHSVNAKQDSPEESRSASARQIGQINQVYSQLYGFKHLQVFMIQPTTLALFTLLIRLNGQAEQEAFSVLCTSACANARLWPLCAGMLRMIQQTGQKMHIELPASANQALQEFEDNIWPINVFKFFDNNYPGSSGTHRHENRNDAFQAVLINLTRKYQRLAWASNEFE